MEQIYAYLQRNQTNRDRTTVILINIFPNWVHQFYFPPYFSFNVHIKQETARKGRHFIMLCSKQYIFKGDGGREDAYQQYLFQCLSTADEEKTGK